MADMPWWWIVLLSGSTVVAMVISLIVPAVTTYQLYREKREMLKRQENVAQAPQKSEKTSDAGGVELRDWREASELPGCPWKFENCDNLADALECIWMPIADQELLDAFSALREQLQAMRVARILATWSEEEYFAIVYTLMTGVELFGVAPLEHEVSLELSHEACFTQELSMDRSPPRKPVVQSPRSSPAAIRSKAAVAEDAGSRQCSLRRLQARRNSLLRGGIRKAGGLSLPSLAPFYRVHDGFGSVLSPLDLPALLSNPDDTMAGSCFYIYPTRSLQPLARRPSLVKFARVDHHCVVCVDRRRKEAGIVYLERGKGVLMDDYPPLAFAADTVRNIAYPPRARDSGANAGCRSELGARGGCKQYPSSRSGCGGTAPRINLPCLTLTREDPCTEVSWPASPRSVSVLTHEDQGSSDAASESSFLASPRGLWCVPEGKTRSATSTPRGRQRWPHELRSESHLQSL